MKTNKEIRDAAWKVARGKWFWRIFTAGILLYFIIIMVSMAIAATYGNMNIQTWSGFLEAKIRAAQSGLGYAIPSMDAFWKMTGATAFQQFIGYVFGAILVFGMTGLFIKAVRNDDSRWFAGSFDGFKRPLEVAWLMVLMNLKVMLWTLLFIIPGWVAVYRYRQAWYLKSENPELSASQCIAESARLMRGHKWQALCLDMTYLGWILAAWMVFVGAAVAGTVLKDSAAWVSFLSAAISLIGIYFFSFALAYFFVGRTVFYHEVKAAATGCANSEHLNDSFSNTDS